VLSLLLVAVTTAAWLGTARDGRLRWWLVPLSWVWATAHGLWSAGALIGLVAWLGLVLDGRLRGRRAALGLAVPVLSVLVTALTPVGPRLLTSQLAVSARTSLIAEWGPTSFREVPALAAAALVGWLVVLWARRSEAAGRVPWTHVLLLVLAAGWILLVTRMVAAGAVVAAPLLVSAIQATVPSHQSDPTARRVERVGVGVVVLAFVVALVVGAPSSASRPERVPDRFDARVSALPAGSVLLVEDGIGAWVEWRHPGVHPVIDGMLDAYPVRWIQRFHDFKQLEPGWQDFVADSGAEAGIMKRGSPATAALQDQLGWKVVATQRDWVYVVAP